MASKNWNTLDLATHLSKFGYHSTKIEVLVQVSTKEYSDEHYQDTTK